MKSQYASLCTSVSLFFSSRRLGFGLGSSRWAGMYLVVYHLRILISESPLSALNVLYATSGC